MTDFFKHLSPRCRNETIANAGDVYQIFAPVIAHNERVEPVWPWDVSAYD